MGSGAEGLLRVDFCQSAFGQQLTEADTAPRPYDLSSTGGRSALAR
ncbi:hypothetical protein QO012_004574 [Methylobacterium aerolatum]|uniref:Uncharacterized protein n=1 Tax=Methylobacterium aerolatum TaxID=418708 RepID=A0ABU0I606_9HYPH|nr:hypothetical protein [Methylobacterium aerolatum]